MCSQESLVIAWQAAAVVEVCSPLALALLLGK